MKMQSPEDWLAENPVLAKGELGLEVSIDGSRAKYGDGKTPWADLTYLGEPPQNGDPLMDWIETISHVLMGQQFCGSKNRTLISQALERLRNRDAAPAARATSAEAVVPHTDSASDRSGNPTSHGGTGNTWSPLWNPKPGEILPKAVVGVTFNDGLRKYVVKIGDGKTAWEDLPLLSSVLPDCAAPFQHGAGSAQEPAAWATFYPNGSTASVYIGRVPPHAVPLYRHPQPTLTDEEREAIQWAIDALVGIEDFAPGAVSADASAAATLRKLLERMWPQEKNTNG